MCNREYQEYEYYATSPNDRDVPMWVSIDLPVPFSRARGGMDLLREELEAEEDSDEREEARERGEREWDDDDWFIDTSREEAAFRDRQIGNYD